MKRRRAADREMHGTADTLHWPERDLKALRRLVRKYGQRGVSGKMSEIVPIGPGRPTRGDLPHFEGIHLAQWLNEAAAEHKANGTRAFASAAIYDLFLLVVDEQEQKIPGRYDRFEKTTKRKWIEGRKQLTHHLKLTGAKHASKSAREAAQEELRRIRGCEK